MKNFRHVGIILIIALVLSSFPGLSYEVISKSNLSDETILATPTAESQSTQGEQDVSGTSSDSLNNDRVIFPTEENSQQERNDIKKTISPIETAPSKKDENTVETPAPNSNGSKNEEKIVDTEFGTIKIMPPPPYEELSSKSQKAIKDKELKNKEKDKEIKATKKSEKTLKKLSKEEIKEKTKEERASLAYLQDAESNTFEEAMKTNEFILNTEENLNESTTFNGMSMQSMQTTQQTSALSPSIYIVYPITVSTMCFEVNNFIYVGAYINNIDSVAMYVNNEIYCEESGLETAENFV